jgi:7-cyano-7-deazaguanine synthase
MERKAFVLLSGGLDSSTLLAFAQRERFEHLEGLSAYYGQRHSKELDYAKKQCKARGVEFKRVDLGRLLEGGMLTDHLAPIPNSSYADLPVGVSPTYVPFRNGTLLSAITAHAKAWVNEGPRLSREATVFFGAHAEDAHNWAYPDCTPEFIGAMANAIYVGTYHTVRLATPLMWMMKHEIVTLGHRLGVDFADTWSCYAGGEEHCGVCPTCRARSQAFTTAQVADPTIYAGMGLTEKLSY